MQFAFIACQVEGYQYILKLNCQTLAFTSFKAFFKKKTSIYLIFCMNFEEKYRLWYILLTDQNSLSGCFYFMRYWAISVCNCLLTRLRRQKFWNWPYLSIQTVFSTWPKSQGKNLNILRTKWDFELK